jgi:hypothetical protein
MLRITVSIASSKIRVDRSFSDKLLTFAILSSALQATTMINSKTTAILYSLVISHGGVGSARERQSAQRQRIFHWSILVTRLSLIS